MSSVVVNGGVSNKLLTSESDHIDTLKRPQSPMPPSTTPPPGAAQQSDRHHHHHRRRRYQLRHSHSHAQSVDSEQREHSKHRHHHSKSVDHGQASEKHVNSTYANSKSIDSNHRDHSTSTPRHHHSRSVDHRVSENSHHRHSQHQTKTGDSGAHKHEKSSSKHRSHRHSHQHLLTEDDEKQPETDAVNKNNEHERKAMDTVLIDQSSVTLHRQKLTNTKFKPSLKQNGGKPVTEVKYYDLKNGNKGAIDASNELSLDLKSECSTPSPPNSPISPHGTLCDINSYQPEILTSRREKNVEFENATENIRRESNHTPRPKTPFSDDPITPKSSTSFTNLNDILTPKQTHSVVSTAREDINDNLNRINKNSSAHKYNYSKVEKWINNIPANDEVDNLSHERVNDNSNSPIDYKVKLEYKEANNSMRNVDSEKEATEENINGENDKKNDVTDLDHKSNDNKVKGKSNDSVGKCENNDSDNKSYTNENENEAIRVRPPLPSQVTHDSIIPQLSITTEDDPDIAPSVTITSMSAKGYYRASSFYQDMMEAKSYLKVRLVRQNTNERLLAEEAKSLDSGNVSGSHTDNEGKQLDTEEGEISGSTDYEGKAAAENDTRPPHGDKQEACDHNHVASDSCDHKSQTGEATAEETQEIRDKSQVLDDDNEPLVTGGEGPVTNDQGNMIHVLDGGIGEVSASVTNNQGNMIHTSTKGIGEESASATNNQGQTIHVSDEGIGEGSREVIKQSVHENLKSSANIDNVEGNNDENLCNDNSVLDTSSNRDLCQDANIDVTTENVNKVNMSDKDGCLSNDNGELIDGNQIENANANIGQINSEDKMIKGPHTIGEWLGVNSNGQKEESQDKNDISPTDNYVNTGDKCSDKNTPGNSKYDRGDNIIGTEDRFTDKGNPGDTCVRGNNTNGVVSDKRGDVDLNVGDNLEENSRANISGQKDIDVNTGEDKNNKQAENNKQDNSEHPINDKKSEDLEDRMSCAAKEMVEFDHVSEYSDDFNDAESHTSGVFSPIIAEYLGNKNIKKQTKAKPLVNTKQRAAKPKMTNDNKATERSSSKKDDIKNKVKRYNSVNDNKKLKEKPAALKPLVVKQKAQIKIRYRDKNKGRNSPDKNTKPVKHNSKQTNQKSPRSTNIYNPSKKPVSRLPALECRPLGVPVQLKSEALWHDNVLRVLLRGPREKLPPLNDQKNSGNKTFPVNVELTFIPQVIRRPVSPKRALSPISHKPKVVKKKTISVTSNQMLASDTDILDMRATGEGFDTRITKDSKIPLLPPIDTRSRLSSISMYSQHGVSVSKLSTTSMHTVHRLREQSKPNK